MLDEFLWGQVARISPEAPVPVVEIARQSFHLGGAANVAGNVRALGGQAVVAGVVGRRRRGRARARRALAAAGVEDAPGVAGGRPADPRPSRRASSPTTSRWCGRTARTPTTIAAALEERAAGAACARALPAPAARVILSDYQKGVVTAARDEGGAGRWRGGAACRCWSTPRCAHFALYRGVAAGDAEPARRRSRPPASASATTADLRGRGRDDPADAALRGRAHHPRRARHEPLRARAAGRSTSRPRPARSST